MHFNDYSIHRTFLQDKRRRREAKAIGSLAFGLSRHYLELEDIAFPKTDPPDFELLLRNGVHIGLELTTLLRRPSLWRKGDVEEMVAFPQWEKSIKALPHSTDAEFKWSKQSLPQMFSAFKMQMVEKEQKVSCIVKKYDELWLCFRTTRGNPIGLVLQYQGNPTYVGDVFVRLWGRFFMDIKEFVGARNVFSTVIFASENSFLGFTNGNSSYTSRRLGDVWYTKGKELSDHDYGSHSVVNTTIINQTVHNSDEKHRGQTPSH